MRLRNIAVFFTFSVLVTCGLTGCDNDQSQGPPGTVYGDGQRSTGDAAGSSETSEPATEEPDPDVDIRTVDLANATWLYSFSGFDQPVEVQLVDGTASSDGDGFPITYTLGEVSYGDIDGDGDDDAAALLSRAQSNGSEALWYVWLAQGAEAVQVKYPIARTGRCGTLVEPLVIGDGAIIITEYLRVPRQDDNIPCSEPGTGLKKRTITIHAARAETWPVQTAPVPAWGGLCAGGKYPDAAPGLVDLWAAPVKSAAVAAVAGPDNGVIFDQKDSPLMKREGWTLVGFRLFGVESDTGGADTACAWAQS